jgi:hypothetical protein
VCGAQFSNVVQFRQHLRIHDHDDRLRDQRNMVINQMVASGFSKLDE